MIKHLQNIDYASRTKLFTREKVRHFTFNFTLENQIHQGGEYFNDKWVVGAVGWGGGGWDGNGGAGMGLMVPVWARWWHWDGDGGTGTELRALGQGWGSLGWALKWGWGHWDGN